MQWNVQEVVKRIVNELQKNGYVTWFGARCMYSPRALALTLKMFLSCSPSANQPQCAAASLQL
jgi:hypothetical protein